MRLTVDAPGMLAHIVAWLNATQQGLPMAPSLYTLQGRAAQQRQGKAVSGMCLWVDHSCPHRAALHLPSAVHSSALTSLWRAPT